MLKNVLAAGVIAMSTVAPAALAQDRITVAEDLAVCNGLFLAIQLLEVEIDRSETRLPEEGTVYIDDDRSVRRGMERERTWGKHSGLVEAFNTLIEEHRARGCDDQYLRSLSREVCNSLTRFSETDKRHMNCPDD